jgi:hypothetical protein
MAQRSTMIPNGGELLILGNVTVDPNQLIRGELQVNTGTRLYTTTLIDGDNRMTGTNRIDGDNTIEGQNLITGTNRMTGTNQIDGDNTIDGTTLVTGVNTVEGTTTINNTLTVTGDGTQLFGSDGLRMEEYWGDQIDTNELVVNSITELNTATTINGDLTVTGDGTQLLGSDGNRIEEYWGDDMDLSNDLLVGNDVTIDNDLFMNPENKKNFLDLPVQYTIYVKKNGDDSRSGENLSNAVKTVKRGLELARAFRRQNPVTTLDADTTTIMVSVYPGIYVEDGHLEIPENGALVSAGGQYVTELHASDDCRNNFRNMVWMNSGSYVQGFSFRNQMVDSFDDPTGGFAVGFAPGANIKRSPYIRDCSQVSNYYPTPAAPPLDPANANPEVGRGGGVVLADKRIVDQNSIFPYILCFGATPRSNNGIGYCARDGGGVNGISSLGIFQRICFYELNGGQVTLNNSGTQFGDISMQATGFVDVVEEVSVDDPDTTLVANATAAQMILDAADEIIDDMWANLIVDAPDGYGYEPDGSAFGTGSSSWTNSFAYDEALARRDSNTVIQAVATDLALGTNFYSLSCGRAFQRVEARGVLQYGVLNQTLSSFDFMRSFITGDAALLTKKPYNGANVTLWSDVADGNGGRIVYEPEDPVYPNRFDEIDVAASLALWQIPNGGTGLISDPDSVRFVKNRFENIIEMVSVNKTNEVQFADLSTIDADRIAAKNAMQDNKLAIINAVMAQFDWEDLYTQPGTQVDEELVEEKIALGKRDLTYTIDAICYDIMYSSTYGTNITINAYFNLAGENILPDFERVSVLPPAMLLLKDEIANYVAAGAVLTEAQGLLDTIATEIGKATLDAGIIDYNPALLPDISTLVDGSERDQQYDDYQTILAAQATLTDEVITYMDTVFENYYEILTKRDANTLLQSLAFDLKGASQQVTQTFSLGLFATRAIKVFNDTPDDVTGKSIQDAFIWCWDYLKGRLTGVWDTNSSIDSGASYYSDTGLFPSESPESQMIIALLDDVLKITVTDPVIIQFSSLVESLAHQFNNAGAGVNRNALPLNFRYPGFNRPVPFSVIQSKGGRVRWSGSDELNTQYFAGGTRINGITGKFEGRPFNISVRQIARRIANARGIY